MSTSDSNICPTCGAEIPSVAPAGMCPKCLLGDALPAASPAGNDDATVLMDSPPKLSPEAKAARERRGESPSPHDPKKGAQQFAPPIEDLADLFPDLEILELLGAGGMGAVYKARQPRLDRLVALKILSCPAEYHDNFALRFEREAQLLAKLNHPNIVTLYDFGELDRSEDDASENNLFYFMMEYVDGADLSRLIHDGGLGPEQALRLVPQICDALQFAHDEGITHRDIKPANILVDKKGKVRIADFGLAKLIAAEQEEAMMTGLTMTGTSMGTPHYMAPEQWDAPEKVDHRADIYSLGVVFYEMLTGSRPHGVFSPPSKQIKVDDRIDSVVLKALEKEPDLRYQQASEVKEDVTRVVSEPVVVGPASKSRKGLWVGVSLALLAVAGVVIWQQGFAPEKPGDGTDPDFDYPHKVPDTGSNGGGGNPDSTVTEKVDLLAAIDPAVHKVGPNRWERGEEGFTSVSGRHGMLVPPVPVPSNYDLELRILPLQQMAVTLPVGSNFATVVFNKSNPLPSVGGIEMINGNTISDSDNQTRFSPSPILNGEESEILIRVREQDENTFLFEVFHENEPLTSWEGDPSQLSTVSHWTLPEPNRLGLGASYVGEKRCSYLSAVLRPVEGTSSKKNGRTNFELSNRSPGRLRAAGTTHRNEAPELSRADGVSDFVDVAGQVGNWVALRANGQTISSHGRADFSGIRKIGWSFGQRFVLIDEEGAIRYPDEVIEELPPELDGVSLVDVKLGTEHGIALGEDGRAFVFGKRYQEQVGDPADGAWYGTPKWPQPPAEVLTGVFAIAVTTTHAATLKRDGTLFVFGWEGVLDLNQPPNLGKIVEVACSEDQINLLDEYGRVWRLVLPRNPAPNQPVLGHSRYYAISSEEEVVTTLHGECWLESSGAWRHMIEDADGFLREAKMSEGVVPVFDGGVFEKKRFLSLLWIEPTTAETSAVIAQPLTFAAMKERGGQLRAWSESGGREIDLSAAEGIEDLVRVEMNDGAKGEWGAVRVSGELIGVGQQSGGLTELGSHRKWTLEELLETLPNGSVASDVSWGFGWAMILTADGIIHLIKGDDFFDSDDLKRREHQEDRWETVEIRVAGLRDVVSIDSKMHSGMVLTKDGQLVCFNLSISGPAFSEPPKDVSDIVQISCGSSNHLALSSQGEVWNWDREGNIFEMPVLPGPAVTVKAHQGVGALSSAQMEGGRWISWTRRTSDQPAILTKLQELGPAIDIFGYRPAKEDGEVLLWIEPVE